MFYTLLKHRFLDQSERAQGPIYVIITYIGLLEVDKAAFLSLADVLGINRWDKFFFFEISFINIHRASRI